MRELYIDCSMGVAGDMLSAALLELCEDRQTMLVALNALEIPGVEYSLETVQRYSVTGSHLSVRYLGHMEEQGSTNPKPVHHHNGLGDIEAIVDGLRMTAKVKAEVKTVYRSIAQAEAKVHGCTVEKIHFHELGTMDAVADICAACYIVDALGVERITSSPVCTGFGTVRCTHGVMPVPAPATAILLEGSVSFAGDTEGELCTPTGAALVKHFASAFASMPQMKVLSVGYGMGGKDFGRLSCVRASLGESDETIVELCCNVDDMTPEAVGFAIEELLRAGAPDAYYQPIGMKKNRPGVLLTCLCQETQRDEMLRLIFKHTSTIGVRETFCRRYILKRREKMVSTQYGDVRIKLSEGFGVQRLKAEYDDLARVARDNGLSLEEARNLL